jgi:hypothetical protein
MAPAGFALVLVLSPRRLLKGMDGVGGGERTGRLQIRLEREALRWCSVILGQAIVRDSR